MCVLWHFHVYYIIRMYYQYIALNTSTVFFPRFTVIISVPFSTVNRILFVKSSNTLFIANRPPPRSLFSLTVRHYFCSLKMPDVRIVNENDSFASSDTFSSQDSTELARRQLRRRNTVSQLTRKVSRRISQSVLGGNKQHSLTERNIQRLTGSSAFTSPHPRLEKRQLHDTEVYDPICEDVEEEYPTVNVDDQQQARLYESYATFCQSFTVSGSNRRSRVFDLAMGTERGDEKDDHFQTKQTPECHTLHSLQSPTYIYPEYITVYSEPGPVPAAFPISPPSSHLDTPISQSTECKKNSHECSRPDTPIYEDNISNRYSGIETSRNYNYPRPPPQIITPAVYMDMQRKERERKSARRHRILNPFRSWFMNSQPSWTRRYRVAE